MCRIAGIFAIMACLCASAPAYAEDRAEAGVTVMLVSPAEASAAAATRLLFSQTPGVLTIAIPGAGALELTATGVDAADGAFTFAAAASGGAALRALMADLAAGASTGSLTSGLALGGMLAGQGIQLVILGGSQRPDGSGTLRATITFD